MKKRVLATILTVCLLFSVLACVASAASVEVGEIVTSLRICPGKVINSDVISEPEIKGYFKSSGWEIRTIDNVWLPYDGETIDENINGLRYYVVDYDGNYTRSNECDVRVAHNPIGDYQYSGTDHWRVCDDCGGQAEKGGHTHLGAEASSADKVCRVCGHVRTSQYTGVLSFWDWLISTVMGVLTLFGVL